MGSVTARSRPLQSEAVEKQVNQEQQAWLEKLKPEVRKVVEAEIAFYDDEELWDFEDVDDDDWESAPWAGAGSGVVAAAD